MYSIKTADMLNLGDLLDNVHEEEKKIHAQYCPWVSFKTSNVRVVMEGKARVLLNPEGVSLAIFGIHTFSDGHHGAWVIPRKGMSMRDRVAFLRFADQQVRAWYFEFGNIYAPVHKDWPEVKDLVLFLGFTILPGEEVAVYGGEEDVE